MMTIAEQQPEGEMMDPIKEDIDRLIEFKRREGLTEDFVERYEARCEQIVEHMLAVRKEQRVTEPAR
jgi:hypothetical protein